MQELKTHWVYEHMYIYVPTLLVALKKLYHAKLCPHDHQWSCLETKCNSFHKSIKSLPCATAICICTSENRNKIRMYLHMHLMLKILMIINMFSSPGVRKCRLRSVNGLKSRRWSLRPRVRMTSSQIFQVNVNILITRIANFTPSPTETFIEPDATFGCYCCFPRFAMFRNTFSIFTFIFLAATLSLILMG